MSEQNKVMKRFLGMMESSLSTRLNLQTRQPPENDPENRIRGIDNLLIR